MRGSIALRCAAGAGDRVGGRCFTTHPGGGPRAEFRVVHRSLLLGWVCAPGRRTITAIIAVADPAALTTPATGSSATAPGR
jgi:hypothetical protein